MLNLGQVADKWPTLARFCRENSLSPPPMPPANRKFGFLGQVFIEGGASDQIRDCMERDLAFAYKTGGLSKDRTRVIVGPKSDPWATLAEFTVGRWIEDAGFCLEEWDPPAAGGRRGDMLVRHRERDIRVFVEVKTHTGFREYLQTGKFRDLAAQHVREELEAQGRADFAFSVAAHTLGDGKPHYDVATVKGATRKLVEAPGETRRETEEKMGALRISIEIGPKGSFTPTTSAWYTLPGSKKLLRCMHGYQKPVETMPSLLVIYDQARFLTTFDDFPSEVLDDVGTVLFGTVVEDATFVPSRVYRKPDGMWSRSDPSELNAVFLVAYRYGVGAEGGSRRVQGYLKPGRENPIRHDLFVGAVDTWFETDLPFGP